MPPLPVFTSARLLAAVCIAACALPMPVTAVIASVPAVMLLTGKVALLKLPLVLMLAWLVPALITALVAAKVAALKDTLPVAAVLTVLSSVSVLAAVMLALPAVAMGVTASAIRHRLVMAVQVGL